MSRYIDADKITDIIKKDLKQSEIDLGESYGDEGYEMAVNSRINAMRYILREVDYAPTADVVEVRHGEWKVLTDEYDCEYAKCSCCGEELYDANEDTIDITWKYCPNCGAKMDGERKDGNG